MNILTGLRANADLHLGNYFGGILPMVRWQTDLSKQDKLFMFVPDLHSFTTPIDHAQLYGNTINNVRVFLAAGLDPNNQQTILYRQSRIPQHAQLQWILTCFTYYGEAQRMTEFKDKASRATSGPISMGLLNYPILMAADILLYDSNFVPVGDDQKQHIELTRTLATRINNKFEQDVFTVPEKWEKQLEFSQQEQSLRIKSLSNPEDKMSKSVTDPKGTVLLSDNPKQAAKKVKSATTDSKQEINFNPQEQAGITNLLTLYSLLSGKTLADTKKEWVGQAQYGGLKSAVADLLSDKLTSFQADLGNISSEEAEKVLTRGEGIAQEISAKKLERVERIIGLR